MTKGDRQLCLRNHFSPYEKPLSHRGKVYKNARQNKESRTRRYRTTGLKRSINYELLLNKNTHHVVVYTYDVIAKGKEIKKLYKKNILSD